VPIGSPCEEHLDLILRLREIGADLGAAALPAFELLAVDLPHVALVHPAACALPVDCTTPIGALALNEQDAEAVDRMPGMTAS
jgi:hypothetical protein